MWIIPRNYEHYPYAPDTTVSSEVLSSPELQLETSLFVRSKPLRLQTALRKWKRDKWFRALCGRILNPSQWIAFQRALSTSLQQGIRASRSARQESEREETIPGTSGPTSSTLSNQQDLFGAFLRTSKDTSVKDSKKYSATWNQSVIEQRGEYSARLKQAHRTRENGCLSWPTPEAKNHEGYQMSSGKKILRLGSLVKKNWGTPKEQDSRAASWDRGKSNLGEQVHGLHAQANHNTSGKNPESWTTPCADDTAHRKKRYCQGGTALSKQAAGKLNANWCEQLMGIPVGWTQLPTAWIDSE